MVVVAESPLGVSIILHISGAQAATRKPRGAYNPDAPLSRSLAWALMSTLQFWKPGTAAPGSSLDRANETEENVVPSAPSSGAISIQSARERLPIFKHSR